MGVLIRIAFRNMWEHKAKSLIIGGLVTFGVIIIVIGNAMMDSAQSGLRQGYIDSFTGDIMISGVSDDPLSIFGKESMDMGNDEALPNVPDYDKVIAHLKAEKGVKAMTGMATAFSLLSVDGDEDPVAESQTDYNSTIFGILFGVDADNYFATFPAIKITEGRALVKGEQAIMITQEQREKLEKKYKHPFKPGDKILVTGFGAGGMRIREVELVGIYKRGEINGNAPFMVTDIDTARVLGGLTLDVGAPIELKKGETDLLASQNLDDLFGDTAGMVDTSTASAKKVSYDSAANLLGDTSKREKLNAADTGAWNFILVRLEHSSDAPAEIQRIKAWAASEKLAINVTDWKGASGTFGKMADFIRIAFNIAVLIIVIVAVIIMMNTLVISVIERTSEIGTMRALGAQKAFVKRMFLTETLTITIFFGLLGSIIAIGGVFILNLCRIPIENAYAQLLFGGKILKLMPSFTSVITTIVAVFLVGWFAHLYPVSVALKIQPVKAMQSE